MAIWTYPPDAIIGPRLFAIPAEELFFFVIQTYITSLFYILLNKSVLHAQFITNHEESSPATRRLRTYGQLLLSAATLIGGILVSKGGKGTYLGLILIWACPFLLLTWTQSGYFLLKLPSVCIALPICLPTLYLWFVDELALGRGTWAIESGTKLGWCLWGNLEIEEAIFFLVTNSLVVFGLVAFDRGMAVFDTFPENFQALPDACLPKRSLKRYLQTRRSMTWSGAVFPGALRIDLVLLYSFCRAADDLVDDAGSKAEALNWIQKLTGYLDRAYSGPGKQPRVTGDIDSYTEKNFPVPARSALKLLPTRLLPSGPFYELLEGFRMDLPFTDAKFPIETEADIQLYASRVASTVGELCLWLVFHYNATRLSKDDEVRLTQAATTMGYALQYVNIARDIQVDAEIGRVYLPIDWLSQENLTPRDILKDPKQPKAEVLRQKLLDLAFQKYEKSRPTMNLLPDEVRGPLIVAVESYMEIGRVLREERGVPHKTKKGMQPYLVLDAFGLPGRTFKLHKAISSLEQSV
ncbi:hypothetical protein RRF57_009650 [Xylaria bambusicola]|uniref:Bifunctional lycopene cyclase/phytoene synthase n=1 Tax=Xylaria bambusicola TaxID=326684 RepID=A0AAN7ZC34_9PEZI